MPEQLSVGSLGVDLGPYLQGLDQAAAADRRLNELVLAGAQQQQQAFAQVTARLAEIATGSRAAAAAQQQYTSDIAGLVKEIRDQAAAQREAQRAGAAAAAERRKASQEARDAARAEKAAAKEATAAAQEVAAAERLRAKEAAAANAETSKGGGVLGKLGGFLGSLQGQVVAAFSIAAVKEFFSAVQQNALNTEATISKLTFSNGGNAQAAARDLAFIRFEADRLGLDLNSAGKSYGSFTAAASAANFPLEEARKLFLATAGASTTLKLSADDTQGVLLALTQILSKGTVSAEELRGQIGERLPGAFSIAARAIGVTEAQLNKLLQTGQLKSIDFLPKFAAELQKTFGDGTAQAFDSAIANQNRFENEYNAFLLRFQGATGAATAKAAEYFKRFNEGLDLRSTAGRERLGEAAAQKSIQDYGARLDKLVQEATAQARAANRDISFDVGAVLAEQSNNLNQQLEKAREELKKTQAVAKAVAPGFLRSLSVVLEPGLNGENLDAANKNAEAAAAAEVLAQKRVKLLEGEIAKLGEVAAARKKADMPTDLEGLVKRQQDIIKALKTRQLAATQENKGTGDFLLGAGGLDEQLKAAEKELDRLLGKVDKAAKGAADRLAAALRALEAARVELATKAAQAIIKESDDAATRARLTFEEALRQAELVQKRLEQLEANVRKAGGTGSRADGVIDGAQAQAITQLRIAALDKYYTDLYKITEAREQRLFDLRANSDEKETEALNRKYDKQLQVAKDAIERQAVEEARARDQLALKAEQQQRRIDQAAALGTAVAQRVGEVFGEGTGISGLEAKRAEKRALLEIDKKYAEDTLNNTLLLQGKEGELARAQAAARLAQIKQSIKQVEQEKNSHKATDFLYSLILGDEDDPEGKNRAKVDEIVNTAIQAISTILQAEQQAAQARIDIANRNISELQTQLAAQIELHEQGSASNIKGIIESINAEKAARREAIAEKKRAQKEEALVNTLQQASSLATAAANLILGWSSLPLVGQVLGAISVAAMLASFIATKAAANNAANSDYFVGGFTPDGGKYEAAGTVHKGEFVANQELTRDYRPLFKALHEGGEIDWWGSEKMRALLPDYSLPGKLKEERQQYITNMQLASTKPLEQKLDSVIAELAHIKGSNQNMADLPARTALPDGSIFEQYPNGNTNHIRLNQ